MMQTIPVWEWEVTLSDGHKVIGTIQDTHLSNALRKLHDVQFTGAVSITLKARVEAPEITGYQTSVSNSLQCTCFQATRVKCPVHGFTTLSNGG